MSARRKAVKTEDQFAFYMDLLGHDVLNNNQAVLSYLELIAASPGVDKRVKTLADKAVSHVRTSTVLVDNVKRLISARAIDPDNLKPIDVLKSVELAETELQKFFPAKDIRVVKPPLSKAVVYGDAFASDLILNVFITAARLNTGDDIVLTVSMAEGTFRNRKAWVMRIEDKNAQLPPFLGKEGISSTFSQDISTAVKTTGMLFAKMLAGSLGGDFEARPLGDDTRGKGAVFTVILRKVEKP